MSDIHELMSKKQFIKALRDEIDRVINAGERSTFIPLSFVVNKVEDGDKINDSYIRNVLNRTKSVRLMGLMASVKTKTDAERGKGWFITLVASKNPDPKSRLVRTEAHKKMKSMIVVLELLAKMEDKGVTASSVLNGDVVANLSELMGYDNADG